MVLARVFLMASLSVSPHLKIPSMTLIFARKATVRHTQSRSFLQCVDDNILMQEVEEPTRKGVLLDLVLRKRRVSGQGGKG